MKFSCLIVWIFLLYLNYCVFCIVFQFDGIVYNCDGWSGGVMVEVEVIVVEEVEGDEGLELMLSEVQVKF